MESIAATTSVTMNAMPAAVKARSKRGARALPPELPDPPDGGLLVHAHGRYRAAELA